jgi:hypothetical protein
MTAELILVNGRLATFDRANPDPQAVAVAGGKFIAAGAEQDVRALAGPGTRIIDLKGRRAITDSHLHIIRGGLNYNMKLRWDGVRSLAVEHRGLSLQSTNINTGYGTAQPCSCLYVLATPSAVQWSSCVAVEPRRWLQWASVAPQKERHQRR